MVTGGAGFIGSALSAHLAALGAEVHSASRRQQGPPQVQRHWSLDLAESAAVSRLIRELRPDYVFHLASHVWERRTSSICCRPSTAICRPA